jgi:hypothetical protein
VHSTSIPAISVASSSSLKSESTTTDLPQVAVPVDISDHVPAVRPGSRYSDRVS